MRVEILVEGPWKGQVLEARKLDDEELVLHDEPWYEVLTCDGRKVYGPARWIRVVETRPTRRKPTCRHR